MLEVVYACICMCTCFTYIALFTALIPVHLEASGQPTQRKQILYLFHIV